MARRDTKGSAMIRESAPVLSRSPLNFVGNVEPAELMQPVADVVVMDGFVGNIVLKMFEATTRYVALLIRQELRGDPLSSAWRGHWRGQPSTASAIAWIPLALAARHCWASTGLSLLGMAATRRSASATRSSKRGRRCGKMSSARSPAASSGRPSRPETGEMQLTRHDRKRVVITGLGVVSPFWRPGGVLGCHNAGRVWRQTAANGRYFAI